ncbi:MAG: diaminopimelate epimerase [Planctomycetota bacterium]|jgi:diaminopimelate epimerase
MKFYKYHGLGNDYLVIDPNLCDIELTPEAIRLICDRHFGVGSDGILYGPLRGSEVLKVRIFNPDGSEAEKSGNGLRIFARYLFEKGYVEEKKFSIETLGGPVEAEIMDSSAELIKINMGTITFISDEIPVKGKKRKVINEELNIGNKKHKVTCLSIGNPHCVIPMEEISEAKAKELGPHVEHHELFPNRINMQLLKIIDRNNIEIQIWERGAGYTLASGSSSCATAGAAYKLGLVDEEVNVKMPGGELLINIGANMEIEMTGPVEKVFEGSFLRDLKNKIVIC